MLAFNCLQNQKEIRSTISFHFSSFQLLSHVWFFVIPWTASCQAFLSIANYLSLLKLMFIVLVVPCNHLILCRPLLLLHSVFPSIRVFSNESDLCIRWPKYWSVSFSISISHPKEAIESANYAANSAELNVTLYLIVDFVSQQFLTSLGLGERTGQ